MPDLNTLLADVHCPACGVLLSEWSHIQWGKMMQGRQPEYRLGDPVQWYREADGTIVPPYVSFDSGDYAYAWNCGDPYAVKAVICDFFSVFGPIPPDGFPPPFCPTCGFARHATLVTIEDNIFTEVREVGAAEVEALFGPDPRRVDIVTYAPDGTPTRRHDLFDPPFVYRDPLPGAKGES
jgi:hypothetical protein